MDPDSDDASVDPSIANLQARGYVTELLGELKSGKEATVYLGRGPGGLVAVKRYRDLQARSFKNDGIYRAGRYIGDARIEKAIQQRSVRGLEAQQGMWVMGEWGMLWHLWASGVNVPEPMIGPDPTAYAEAGSCVVMRFIGNEDAPAPRLSEAHLTPDQARDAWNQSLDGLADLLRLGLVHGDYSTYNLLWWENTVIIIDFPQTSDRSNPNFAQLLARDAASLAQSFARHGIRATPNDTLREVQKRARTGEAKPRLSRDELRLTLP
ncbi:RIO1 family regulatory kinase/ATPase [Deinococcus maricopensis]|uniref:non-specific serine/threonine protein kinase n=1 Tax=Deinococcus maricopensis (strain DSM 21211 / LMG 22137 / NRRL B-23946 / LB-34) TaxID=709986 RepID=E8UBQ5_DEIML|nr:RIO1 family regulatory kinase/ATPase [Deinococcus maricopensis]ADV68494.1 RIO-like kinase [Deinococcus maricopensis DSM 21211]